MQELVVKRKQHRKKSLCFGALAIAFLGSTISPVPHAERFQVQFIGAAQAQSQYIPEELQSMKQNAGGYQGSIEIQKRIGDIYLGKYNPKFYNGKLYGSKERNSVEAYVWYALAVARLSHNELLEEALPYDPSLRLEDLSERDLEIIKEATSGYNRLAAQSRFRKGAAGWLAEKIFTDHYKRGPAVSYYILGKMYRSGDYFVRQSYYDAYVNMRVASLAGFANAEELAGQYRGHITLNQIEVAEREASGLLSKTFRGSGGGGGAYYSGGIQTGSGSAISSGQGWSPDFQANRAHRDAGTNGALTPSGVDAHNLATSSFDQGNSYLAAGRIDDAKAAYEAAINAEPSSLAAFNASRQLQALTLTCSLRDDRIRRMIRPENRDRVDEISWERIQIALKALGHFPEFVDGKPDLKTRRAIRAFQRNELNVDETGYLTTDQRVELICAAAQDVRDPDSQIQLGIMYARGIGLNCNTAAAHAWFQRAADKGHPTALYNLGLMYLEGFYDHQAPGSYPPGTRGYLTATQGSQSGTISIKPRKIRDFDMARYFFEEAKAKGHPDAADRISEIKSGKIDKILRENSIVGCIDYEAEIEIARLGQDAQELNNRVSVVLGQMASIEGGSTDQMCKDLKNLDAERSSLAKDADNYLSYFKEDLYAGQTGQSDVFRAGSEFAATREMLGDIETRIKTGLDSCSAN